MHQQPPPELQQQMLPASFDSGEAAVLAAEKGVKKPLRDDVETLDQMIETELLMRNDQWRQEQRHCRQQELTQAARALARDAGSLSFQDKLLMYDGLAGVKGSGELRALMYDGVKRWRDGNDPVLVKMECQKDWLGKLHFVAAQEREKMVPPAVVERMKKMMQLPSPSEHQVVMEQVRRERALSSGNESTTYNEYSAYRLWTGAYLPEDARWDIDGGRSESEKVAQRAAYQRKYFPTFRHPDRRFRAEGGAPRAGEEQARVDALKRWAAGGQGVDEESADDEC
jgi:hypothetical protein